MVQKHLIQEQPQAAAVQVPGYHHQLTITAAAAINSVLMAHIAQAQRHSIIPAMQELLEQMLATLQSPQMLPGPKLERALTMARHSRMIIQITAIMFMRL